MGEPVPLPLNVAGVVNRIGRENARVERVLNPIGESETDQEMPLRRHERESLLEPGAEAQGGRRGQSVVGDQGCQRVRAPEEAFDGAFDGLRERLGDAREALQIGSSGGAGRFRDGAR